MKVLHITPHLGGGVGQVLRALLPALNSACHSMELCALEKIDPHSRATLDRNEIQYSDCLEHSPDIIFDRISSADVVLVHWWNHPGLLVFFKRNKMPKSRFIFWSHISGLNPPNGFSETWLQAPEKFIFTTPVSFISPDVVSITTRTRSKFDVIWSTSGVEKLNNFARPFRERDLGFVYCGNLDFSKVDCSIFDIAKSLFEQTLIKTTIIGPVTADFERTHEERDAQVFLNVTGFIPEAEKIDLISRSKVFLYPLTEGHYGTCDQTIQEALALGLPIVAFRNDMEQQMLEAFEGGFLTSCKKEFIQVSAELILDQERLQSLSNSARLYAAKYFSLQTSLSRFFSTFSDIKSKEKKYLNLVVDEKASPYEVFLESLGFAKGMIEILLEGKKIYNMECLNTQLIRHKLARKNSWMSPTKSSPFHWSTRYPEDAQLLVLCEELKNYHIE